MLTLVELLLVLTCCLAVVVAALLGDVFSVPLMEYGLFTEPPNKFSLDGCFDNDCIFVADFAPL